MATSLTQATIKLHEILEPLSTEERRRAIAAALVLLGENPVVEAGTAGRKAERQVVESDSEDDSQLPAGAKQWMRKNSISLDALEHYFHFDAGTVNPIELPGNAKAKREKTINSYLMQGIAGLLANGEASFTDDVARSLCQHFGCYDAPNHGKYLKKFANHIAGSKLRDGNLPLQA